MTPGGICHWHSQYFRLHHTARSEINFPVIFWLATIFSISLHFNNCPRLYINNYNWYISSCNEFIQICPFTSPTILNELHLFLIVAVFSCYIKRASKFNASKASKGQLVITRPLGDTALGSIALFPWKRHHTAQRWRIRFINCLGCTIQYLAGMSANTAKAPLWCVSDFLIDFFHKINGFLMSVQTSCSGPQLVFNKHLSIAWFNDNNLESLENFLLFSKSFISLLHLLTFN